MIFKKLITLFIAALAISFTQTAAAQGLNRTFKGAEATLTSYKVLYILNNGDEKKIKGTLKNIKNAMEDSRLMGKLEVELVVFGDGVQVYAKDGPFAETIVELQAKGVLLAQCENTIRERKIDKSTLFPFISYVPSASGEIIIRQHQGWAVIHL